MVPLKQQNPEAVVKEIRRQTRRWFLTEEKMRIVAHSQFPSVLSLAGHPIGRYH